MSLSLSQVLVRTHPNLQVSNSYQSWAKKNGSGDTEWEMDVEGNSGGNDDTQYS